MKLRAVIISISILLGSSAIYAGTIDIDMQVPIHDWTVEIGGSEYGIQIQEPIWVYIIGPDPDRKSERRYAAVFNSHEWSVSEKTFWLFSVISLALITGVTPLREARKSTKQGQAAD